MTAPTATAMPSVRKGLVLDGSAYPGSGRVGLLHGRGARFAGHVARRADGIARERLQARRVGLPGR